MRAAIYTRVSSDPNNKGRSVAEQEAECRAVAEREGWTVERVFCDNDRSASRYSTKPRPQYEALLRYVAAGECDVLIAWEASRFQRDLDAYLRLREVCRTAGVPLSYSGRTYDLTRMDDRLSTGFDALLAERESDQTRERVLRATRANAASGRPHGKLTYGYAREYDAVTRELRAQIVRQDQAAVLREVAERFLGGESFYALARELTARGEPAPSGGKWHASNLRRLLGNPAYIGKRVHQGKVIGDAAWPPILDEAVWWQLQARFSDPARKGVRDSTVKHLLSGLASCGVCGSRVRVQKNRTYLAYICAAGFHVARPQAKVDELVSKRIVALLNDPLLLRDLAAADADAATEVQTALTELAAKEAQLESFYDAAARGDITAAGLARVEKPLLAEIDKCRKAAHYAALPAAVRDMADGGTDLDQWHAESITLRREVIRALLDVRILPTRRGARTFDPATVEMQRKAAA